MSFLEVVSRLLRGEPAFIDPNLSSEKQQGRDITAPEDRKSFQDTGVLVDPLGRKIIPELELTHVTSHIDGSQMMVTAWITNPSQHLVRIDTIELMGQKQVSHRELKPGEGHEAILYRGSLASNDHAHRAQIFYRLMENGDCFRADFFVKYAMNGDVYYVDELHPEYPIHDI